MDTNRKENTESLLIPEIRVQREEGVEKLFALNLEERNRLVNLTGDKGEIDTIIRIAFTYNHPERWSTILENLQEDKIYLDLSIIPALREQSIPHFNKPQP